MIEKNLVFKGANERMSSLDLYLPEQEGVPLLIFAHGFKGFKDWGHFPLLFTSLNEHNIGVLAFNFSHNGGTADDPIDFPDLDAFSRNTYSKELEDVGAVLDWIRSNRNSKLSTVDTTNIHLLGHSRGGGIALLAAEKYVAIKKVITWAAVADFKKRLPNSEELLLWKKRGQFFIKNGRTKQDMPMNYSFVEDLNSNQEALHIKSSVEKLNKPQLIVHGKADETVDLSEAHLLKEWNKAAQLEILETANHTFGGAHPWNKDELPQASSLALQKSIEFIKA